jgi:hypothetical protein
MYYENLNNKRKGMIKEKENQSLMEGNGATCVEYQDLMYSNTYKCAHIHIYRISVHICKTQ